MMRAHQLLRTGVMGVTYHDMLYLETMFCSDFGVFLDYSYVQFLMHSPTLHIEI